MIYSFKRNGQQRIAKHVNESYVFSQYYPKLSSYNDRMAGLHKLRAHKVHANGVARARKFVHGSDWEHNWELLITCPHRPLYFKKIKTPLPQRFWFPTQ